jgi:hypothetical protein
VTILQRLADLLASQRANLKTHWRWLSWALTLAALVYVIAVLVVGGLSLRDVNWAAFVPAALATLGLYLLSLLAQLFVWTRILSFHRAPDWQDMEIYSRMLLTRRLPGGFWHWVGRAAMYSAATRVPTRVVVVANFLEWAMLILTGMGLYISGLPSLEPAIRVVGAAAVWVLAVGLAVSWQPAAYPLRRRVAEGLLWAGLYGTCWFLGGAILRQFVSAAGGDITSWIEATRVWALTGSISLFVSIVPAVFGVQEVTLTLLLQTWITPASALIVALLMHFVFSVAEVGWGLAGWGLSAAMQRRQATASRVPIEKDSV